MEILREEKRYNVFWMLGTILSFFLYYFGIVHVYLFYRKVIKKKFMRIVLTYHRIRDDKKTPQISVTQKKFDEQINFLKRYFDIVPLKDQINCGKKNNSLSSDTVSITFDDGYADNYYNGLQILKKYNIPATIFLVSQFIDCNEYLSVKQLMEMKNANICFGSHTINHFVLSELKQEQVIKQINNSKAMLEKILTTKIHFFSYPKGKKKHLNAIVKNETKKAGYLAAFTTENGEIDRRSDLFQLKRIGIRNCPLFVFKVRVTGIFESGIFMVIRRKLRAE